MKNEREISDNPPFIISIDDRFVKWEFGFNPENADDISIAEIIEVLENCFKTKTTYSKRISDTYNK
jgi:hypothetical protein